METPGYTVCEAMPVLTKKERMRAYNKVYYEAKKNQNQLKRVECKECGRTLCKASLKKHKERYHS